MADCLTDDSAVCLEERLVVYSEDCLVEQCLDDLAVCSEERLVVYSGDCLVEQAEESTVERLGVPA